MADEKKSIGAQLVALRWAKATAEDRAKQAERMAHARKIKLERLDEAKRAKEGGA